MIAVFLDACVLVPITLTNVILTAAEDGLLRPYWSPDVIKEAVEAIGEVRQDLSEERIRRRFVKMDEAFEDASVVGNPATLAAGGLPDPDDQHVVAAAIAARATVLVTANIRDFPKTLMADLGLTIMSPDALLNQLLDENETGMVAVITKVAATLRDPERTPEDILVGLELAGAPEFAARARSLLDSPAPPDQRHDR